jgi:hypothetical protein
MHRTIMMVNWPLLMINMPIWHNGVWHDNGPKEML